MEWKNGEFEIDLMVELRLMHSKFLAEDHTGLSE